MAVTKECFSVLPDKREVDKITITNSSGNYICVLNYGCILQSAVIKDCAKNMTDVVMGYDSIEDYASAGGFIGAVVGRCANRISNGTFPLNGKTIRLYQNDGKNHLHGGREGFSKKVWGKRFRLQQIFILLWMKTEWLQAKSEVSAIPASISDLLLPLRNIIRMRICSSPMWEDTITTWYLTHLVLPNQSPVQF